MKQFCLLTLFATVLLIGSCKKSSETLDTPPLSDYYPLQPGKYITYQLDSTVFINFGTVQVTRSYQVKHFVDAEITDNLGRPAYRIIRSIRTDDTQPWVTDATFMAVTLQNSIEFIENNLRFIKLHQPIRNGFTWKGNEYIDTYTPSTGLRYLDNWDYIYDGVGTQENINGHSLKTITVKQRDEIIGNPVDPQSYSEVNYSVEKYAEGIGLVYKTFLHTEYQPEVGQPFGYYSDGSYGITLTLIDYN
jgi:hypothetical protein